MKHNVTPPYLGVAYYPEDWDASEISYDISMMKQAGITVARIGEFAWSRMETEEGVFTFDWLHHVVDALGEAGIAVVMGTPTATPPVWLGQKYPDVFVESENGRRRNHGGRRHCCSNNPDYRRYCARIVEKMAQEFANDENIIGWQLDNEIYGNSGCFCPVCQAKFKDHLREKFGTPQELNRRWNLTLFSQEYTDFEQIPAPRDAWVNPHHKTEWAEFRFASDTEFITMQAEILKKYVSVPVGTDIMPLNGFHYPDLQKKLDVVQFNHYNTVENLWEVCLWFDFIRNLKDTPFWNTETSTCWNGGVDITQTLKPDGFCYANSWLPVAFGGEANMYWLWRTHWAGHELMHGSVISASGRPMHTFKEVQKVSADFAKGADFVNNTKVKPPIAMHFSSISWNLFRDQKIVQPFDFFRYFANYYYKPLIDSCCRPDLIEIEADPDSYRVLFSPFLPTLERAGLSERIRAWVEAGGTWVVGPLTDVRTADGTRYKHRPYGMLEDLAEFRWAFSVPDLAGDLTCTTSDGKPFRGVHWYELFESDADTLAQVTGSPHKELCGKGVFLHKKVGKGQVFFLGTVPDYDTMKNVVLPAVFKAADLSHGGGDGSSFMVIPREGTDRKGLILAEYAGKGGEYHLPAPMRSVLTDEVLEGTVSVKPYDVILLETI